MDTDYSKDNTRSLRRGNTERKHNQRMEWLPDKFGKFPIRKSMLETPKVHSDCRCCSNPRKTGKGKDRFTLQERRLGVTDNEELE